MRRLRFGWVFVFAALAAACGDDTPPTTPSTPAALVGVAIDGPSVRTLGAPGQTIQLRAIATFSDGSTTDVSAASDVAWNVDDAFLLHVSPRGLVTGLANGVGRVTVAYRGRTAATSVQVSELLGPRFQVTGVIRDAARGTPVAGAYVEASQNDGQPLQRAIFRLPLARTDANGFFTLGEVAGPVSIFVSQFGYEEQTLSVPALTAPAALEVRLTPDTAPYIERTLTGEFDGVNDLGLLTSTVRVSTRGTGVFDAALRGGPCEPGQRLQIVAQNGGFGSVSTSHDCDYARLRLALRGSEVRLELQSVRPRRWELTYREPR